MQLLSKRFLLILLSAPSLLLNERLISGQDHLQIQIDRGLRRSYIAHVRIYIYRGCLK